MRMQGVHDSVHDLYSLMSRAVWRVGYVYWPIGLILGFLLLLSLSLASSDSLTQKD
jgi:hypothetical protein